MPASSGDAAASRGDAAASSVGRPVADANPAPPTPADIAQAIASRFQLHAFGNYAAGWSSSNVYLAGYPKFDFGTIMLGLRQVIRPIDGVTLWAGTHFSANRDGPTVEVDLAFASWKPTSWLEVQLGRAYNALGLYTPVFDVGTLRPFQHLPQSVYGPTGLLSESLDGASVVFSLAGPWTFSARLFGGASAVELAHPEIFIEGGAAPIPGANSAEGSLNGLGGAAFELMPPLPSLRLTAGGLVARASEGGVHVTAQAGAEYIGDKLELRGEYALGQHVGRWRAQGAYLEAGYRIIESFQVAVRGEYLSWAALDPGVSLPAPLRSHLAGGVTANYWISRDLVARIAYHYVRNNRLAYLEERLAGVLLGTATLNPNTHVVELGMSFTY